MDHLDCQSVDSTFGCVCWILNISRPQLETILDDIENIEFPGSVPLDHLMREAVTSRAPICHLPTNCFWFHATRADETASFETEGIRPLPEQLEKIWDFLRPLASQLSDQEWQEFRQGMETTNPHHHAYLYRLKVLETKHQHGPFAFLVRDAAVGRGWNGHHDYLRIPELTEDIIRCLADTLGLDIRDQYWQATNPCIVKFSTEFEDRCLAPALTYLYAVHRGLKQTVDCNDNYQSGGKPVPASSVVDVEWLTDDQSG